jgi:hypothetical protein
MIAQPSEANLAQALAVLHLEKPDSRPSPISNKHHWIWPALDNARHPVVGQPIGNRFAQLRKALAHQKTLD